MTTGGESATQRAQTLRRQVLEVAAELARVEEDAAHRYEQMPATTTDAHARRRERAAQAREAAQRLRDTATEIHKGLYDVDEQAAALATAPVGR